MRAYKYAQAESRGSVSPCATAAAMTNCESFSAADLQCVNMFPLWRGGRGICGKPRLFSLCWQQLERRRRWSKFVEPDGAKSYRTVAGMPR